MPTAELTYLEGIRQGLRRALAGHNEVLVFGEDVGAFGGAFKVTLGLQAEFGKDRVFNTPISESAILG
ncbi:MAG: alpha-ketoacid dehydrogenase subunit beta, partial [Lentisphaerota bacterium]